MRVEKLLYQPCMGRIVLRIIVANSTLPCFLFFFFFFPSRHVAFRYLIAILANLFHDNVATFHVMRTGRRAIFSPGGMSVKGLQKKNEINKIKSKNTEENKKLHEDTYRVIYPFSGSKDS